MIGLYLAYQNQNSLLVKRQTDNTTPGGDGAWPEGISPELSQEK